MEIARQATDSELRAGQSLRPLRLKVEAVDLASDTRIEQRSIELIARKLPGFPAATTAIDVSVASVSQPLWYALPNTAVLRVRLKVVASGPLPDSQFLIKGPAEKMRLSTKTITRGTQYVDMDLALPLEPFPAKNTFHYDIVPPPPTGKIRSTCTEQIALEIEGPKKASLVANVPDVVHCWPIARDAQVAMSVSLSGPVTEAFSSAIRIRQPHATDERQIAAPFSTAFALSSPQSYWWGTTDEHVCRIETAQATRAIEAAEKTIVIKRSGLVLVHAVATVLVLGSLCVLGAFWYLLKRQRMSFV